MQLENIIAIAKFAKLSSCLWERPLVGKLQYRGLQPLYEGLERGGSSVQRELNSLPECLLVCNLVVMEWMAAITGDCVGYFRIFGIFL